jgi:hypothetical protein
MERCLVVALASFLLGSCHPPIPEGVYPCRTFDDCPSAWFCRADSRCWSSPDDAGDVIPDAGWDGGRDVGSDTGAADGGIDATAADTGSADVGTDIGCAAVAYYADCDRDGYPAAGSLTLACSTPVTPPCPGGLWTTTAPTAGMTDCADGEGSAHPHSTAWGSNPAWTDPDGTRHYDYNCDGVEIPVYNERGLGALSLCVPSSDTSGYFCEWSGDPPSPNWVGAVPACGDYGDLNTCPDHTATSAECRPTVLHVPQPCR